MDHRRILELALETLQKQRADVVATITEIRELQGGKKRIVSREPGMPALVVVKRGRRTRAERRAQSLRMKKYWAAKRARSAKAAAKTVPAVKKIRSKTEAQKKAISIAMKEAWKKRKAAAARNPNAKSKEA